MKATYKYFSQVFEKYDELNASVQENVTSIRVVKAFVREKHEVGKFRKAADNVYRLFVKAENAMVTVSPIMMVTSYASIILVSWFGANMIVSSELTTGELTSMLTYCMNILMNLLMVAMVFVMLTMSLASGKRVAGVLNEKSTCLQIPKTLFTRLRTEALSLTMFHSHTTQKPKNRFSTIST